MLVGQRVGERPVLLRQAAGHDGRVALGNIRLAHGVDDVLAAGLLRQVVPREGPVVLRVQRDGLARCRAVGQKLNLDGIRAQAIGVLGVVPYLGHADLRGFNGVRVRQREGVVAALIHGGFDQTRVAVDLRLADRVRVLAALAVDRLLFQRCGPVVLGGKFQSRHDGLGGGTALGAQHVYRHLLGAHAVLVAGVIPHLGNAQVHHRRGVRVPQRVHVAHVAVGIRARGTFNGALVPANRIFHNGIHILVAIRVRGGQPAYACLPPVLGVQRDRVADLLGRAALDATHNASRHGVRAHLIDVVIVVPYLGDGNLHLGLMLVHDGEARSRAAGHGRIIARDLRELLHRIFDGLAGLIVHRQVGPLVAPVVVGAQRHRITRCLTVRIQLRLHAVMADGGLGVTLRVEPRLVHGNGGGGRLAIIELAVEGAGVRLAGHVNVLADERAARVTLQIDGCAGRQDGADHARCGDGLSVREVPQHVARIGVVLAKTGVLAAAGIKPHLIGDGRIRAAAIHVDNQRSRTIERQTLDIDGVTIARQLGKRQGQIRAALALRVRDGLAVLVLEIERCPGGFVRRKGARQLRGFSLHGAHVDERRSCSIQVLRHGARELHFGARRLRVGVVDYLVVVRGLRKQVERGSVAAEHDRLIGVRLFGETGAGALVVLDIAQRGMAVNLKELGLDAEVLQAIHMVRQDVAINVAA